MRSGTPRLRDLELGQLVGVVLQQFGDRVQDAGALVRAVRPGASVEGLARGGHRPVDIGRAGLAA